MANTWYVSNAAVNPGYVLGSNSNSGNSPGTAVLTIDYAVNTLASAGDTVIVNPSGTEYSENSSSLNLLNFSKSVTLETDPAYVGSAGKATITSASGGAHTLELSAAVTLNNLRVDNGGYSRAAVLVITSASTNNINSVDFLNVVSGQYTVQSPSSGISTIILSKCTLLATNGNGSNSYLLNVVVNSTAGSSYSVLGCTLNGVGGVCQELNVVQHTLTFEAASDGTRNTFTNLGACIAANFASQTTTFTLNVSGTDLVYNSPSSVNSYFFSDIGSTYRGSVYSITYTGCTTTIASASNTIYGFRLVNGTSQCYLTQNTYSGSGAAAYLAAYLECVGINNFHFNNNTCNLTGAGSDAFIGAILVGTGYQCNNNNVSSDGSFHILQLGNDGPLAILKNDITGSLSAQNLGDVSGNNYIAQPYTWPAASSTFGGLNWFEVAQLMMQKVGSPTGTVTVSIYSNNAGAPGSQQTVATYTLSASLLPSSTSGYKQVNFWSRARWNHTASTAYWLVVEYSGTNDNTNYVQIEKNTAAVGTLNKSSNGSAWTAGSGALCYVLGSNNISCVAPQVTGNTVSMTNASPETTHCIIVCGTDGASVSRNYSQGGAIPWLLKDVDGSVNPATCCGNLAKITTGGTQGGLFSKGNYRCNFYNNTVIVEASGGDYPVYVIPDPMTSLFSSSVALNGQPDDHTTMNNNIVLSESASVVLNIGANPIFYDYGVTNFTFLNNLVWSPNASTFGWVNLGQNATYTTYTSYASFVSGTSLNSGGLNEDPLLSNESTPQVPSDFTPTSSSPVIGAGINSLETAPYDYFGNTWAITPDIGAISYQGAINNQLNSPSTRPNPVGPELQVYNPLSLSKAQGLLAATPLGVTVTGSVGVPPTTGLAIIGANTTGGAITTWLPDARQCLGMMACVSKTDSSGNAVSVESYVSGQFSTATLSTQYSAVTVASNGTTWQVVGSH